LFALKTRQPLKAHVEDGTRLDFSESKSAHQTFACCLRVYRRANQRNHLIEVVERNKISLKNMSSFLRFSQLEPRPPYHHFVAVINEIFDQLFEIECLRTPFHERYVVNTK